MTVLDTLKANKDISRGNGFFLGKLGTLIREYERGLAAPVKGVRDGITLKENGFLGKGSTAVVVETEGSDLCAARFSPYSPVAEETEKPKTNLVLHPEYRESGQIGMGKVMFGLFAKGMSEYEDEKIDFDSLFDLAAMLYAQDKVNRDKDPGCPSLLETFVDIDIDNPTQAVFLPDPDSPGDIIRSENGVPIPFICDPDSLNFDAISYEEVENPEGEVEVISDGFVPAMRSLRNHLDKTDQELHEMFEIRLKEIGEFLPQAAKQERILERIRDDLGISSDISNDIHHPQGEKSEQILR